MSVDTDQSGAIFVGRAREKEVFEEILSSAAPDRPVVVGIEGRAGSGKTALMRELAAIASPNQIGYGKYDAVRTRPYEGVATALRQVVALALDSQYGDEWRSVVLDRLGTGQEAVGALIPELSAKAFDPGWAETVDSEAALRALQRAVETVLDETTRRLGPITLLIDDLQWAGHNTLSLIEHIAAIHTSGLTVVAAWRPHDRSGPKTATDVVGQVMELDDLDPDTLRELFLALSGHPPDSDVVETLRRATAGNAQFATELIVQDLGDGRLRRDPDSGRWAWDRVPRDDLAGGLNELLLGRLEAMPSEQADVVSAAAALGTAFTLSDLAAATGTALEQVTEAVESPVGSSFIQPTKRNDGFRFAHDRLAEVAIERLTTTQRQEVNLRLARHLLDNYPEQRVSDAMVHAAAGVDLINSDQDRLEYARLALQAGDEARNSAAFSLALGHYETGLELCADLEPALAGRLAVRAAEAAWLTQAENVDIFIRRARSKATEFSDRARLTTIEMKLDLATGQPDEAMNALHKGLEVLGEVGIEIPESPSPTATGAALQRTRSRLKKLGIDGLAGLNASDDPEAIWAEQVLGEMFSTTYAVSPERFPFVVLEAIGLTLDRGRLPMTPVALAGYALLLVISADDPLIEKVPGDMASKLYHEAFDFGRLAMSLADDPRSHRYRPWTQFLYYDFIFHWHRPLSDAVAGVTETQREAIEVGDPAYGAYAAVVETAQRFLGGYRFDETARRGHELLGEMTASQKKQAEIQAVIARGADRLAEGLGPDFADLSLSDGFGERSIIESGEDDDISLAAVFATKMHTHVLAGRYADAAALAGKAMEHYQGLAATAGIPYAWLVSSFTLFKAEPEARETVKHLRVARRKFRRWQKISAENQGAASALIEGLWRLQRGNQKEGLLHLEESAAEAARRGHRWVEGLANLTIAGVVADLGETESSEQHLLATARAWAAMANVAGLESLVESHPHLEEVANLLETTRAHDADLEDIVDRLAVNRSDGLGGHATVDVYALCISTSPTGDVGTSDAERAALNAETWTSAQRATLANRAWHPQGEPVALFRSSKDAVSAARQIITAHAAKNRRVVDSGHLPLPMGVGIARGEVRLQRIDKSWEAAGSPVSEAARLASLAAKTEGDLVVNARAADPLAGEGIEFTITDDPAEPGRQLFSAVFEP